jgi:hypothetical protein
MTLQAPQENILKEIREWGETLKVLTGCQDASLSYPAAHLSKDVGIPGLILTFAFDQDKELIESLALLNSTGIAYTYEQGTTRQRGAFPYIEIDTRQEDFARKMEEVQDMQRISEILGGFTGLSDVISVSAHSYILYIPRAKYPHSENAYDRAAEGERVIEKLASIGIKAHRNNWGDVECDGSQQGFLSKLVKAAAKDHLEEFRAKIFKPGEKRPPTPEADAFDLKRFEKQVARELRSFQR